MSSYRTITVNASLSKAQIDVPSTALSGNIAASAEIATPVKHSIVLDYNALENKPEINRTSNKFRSFRIDASC